MNEIIKMIARGAGSFRLQPRTPLVSQRTRMIASRSVADAFAIDRDNIRSNAKEAMRRYEALYHDR